MKLLRVLMEWKIRYVNTQFIHHERSIVQYDNAVHCYSTVYPLLFNGDNPHLKKIMLSMAKCFVSFSA